MTTSSDSSSNIKVDWWRMLLDPDFIRSPHQKLHSIRKFGAIQFDAETGIYFVLGHREFRQLAMAPEMGRDTQLWVNGWSSPQNRQKDPLSYDLFSEFQRQMVNSNPPDHRRMRDVYERAFSPKRMLEFFPMIQAEAKKLISNLPEKIPFDFMENFANKLPLRVSRNLFGIPAEMDDQLAKWNSALIKIGDILMTPDQKSEALLALREYKDFLRKHLASKPNDSEEIFISLAQEALSSKIMDEEETINNCLGLISGNETTVSLLGNGLLSLLKNRVQFDKLRNDLELMRSAIEEMLRYEPSINFILRVAIKDFQCGEIIIPQGSMAIGLVNAINRDPERFEEPEKFDISRQPNAQSIFGGGPHVCIGAALARMEAQICFSILMEEFSLIELAGEPLWWIDRTNQRGLKSLPIVISRYSA